VRHRQAQSLQVGRLLTGLRSYLLAHLRLASRSGHRPNRVNRFVTHPFRAIAGADRCNLLGPVSHVIPLSLTASLNPTLVAATTVILVLDSLVTLWLIEIPPACFVIAPDRTPHAFERANSWISRGGLRPRLSDGDGWAVAFIPLG
jgi:hypothetical protein